MYVNSNIKIWSRGLYGKYRERKYKKWGGNLCVLKMRL